METVGGADGHSARTPLVGRSDELADLLTFCASEAGGAAIVSGDAGIGKSRLLDELGERVAASGALVLRGHAVSGGGPFRPLARALVRVAPSSLAEDERLRPFGAVLARLLPSWPAPAAGGGHLVDPVVVLGEAVLELLRVISSGRGCGVLLDDMHRADRDSLLVVEYLVTALSGMPVHLVLAARDDEFSPPELGAVRRRARSVPLARRTRRVGRVVILGPLVTEGPFRASTSIRIATRPVSSTGRCTVVRGGLDTRASQLSSMPMTLMSRRRRCRVP
jgi:hypothetical protein